MVLKTGPDRTKLAGHGFGLVQWVKPSKGWTDIEPDEPTVGLANWPVPFEPNGSTHFYFFPLPSKRRCFDAFGIEMTPF